MYFIKTGNTSSAFLSFISQISDKKIEDVDKVVNLHFSFIQEISIESIQSVLERLGVLLDELLNLTSKVEFYSDENQINSDDNI